MGLANKNNENLSLKDAYINSKNQRQSFEEENLICNQDSEVKVKLPFEVKEGEEYFVEQIGKVKSKPVFSFVKRFFDILISFLGICVFLLPFLIIALIIKCTSKGSVFYKQERLGYKGKKFNIIKFRTMVIDAEKYGAQWCEGNEDDRIYPFGRFLRKTHLDELPQLFCCFIGTMSFVGPRPERECYYNEFEKFIHGFNQRLKVKPGLTGHAQVNGGYDLKPQEKILYDVEYIKNRSLWFDLKIILKTVGVVITFKGVK